MTRTLAPLLTALQFLTRFPLPQTRAPDDDVIARSLRYYPVAGLLLGTVVAAMGVLLGDAPAMLSAALVLALWVLLTGALHLDGLADCADAWVGGIGDRERTLAIMKDPHSGPAAVTVLLVMLLVKFASLHALMPYSGWVLVFIPALARGMIPLLLLTTPYVRPQGLGAPLNAKRFALANGLSVAVVSALCGAVAGIQGLWLLIASGVTFVVIRAALLRRIGGTTGDSAGALIELTETAMLVAAALYHSRLTA